MNFNEPVDEKTLLQFVRVMTGGSDAVVAKVRLYLDQPMEYVSSPYAELSSFEQEDIEESLEDPDFRKRTFPGDVLACVLMGERYIIRVDHRSSLDNIQWVVDSQLAQKSLAPMQWVLSKEQRRGVTSYDFLNLTARDLEVRGVQLAWIDDGWDSFLVFLVTKEDFKEIMRFADELGITIKTKFA